MSTPHLSRRQLLTTLLAAPVALSSGCGADGPPLAGEIIGPSVDVGHRIRDRKNPPQPAPDAWNDVGVLIVGGGIAGLSAAWRMQRAEVSDYLVLELESTAGGTSRSDASQVSAYPWGAHYLPLPQRENRGLIQLLDEMQVLERIEEDGTPIAREQFLCRDPQERVYFQGQWIEGVYPAAGATAEDRRQLEQFQQEIDSWVNWRDDRGRRAFTIPIAASSDDAKVAALDELTMADWLAQHGFNSTRLRWLVDYSCRDDYGLHVEETSAWAGLFYFASRARESSRNTQPLLTWPEGNGRIVNHLAGAAGARLQSGQAVLSIKSGKGKDRTEVVVLDVAADRIHGFRAQQVIFAAPQFLTPYLIQDLADVRREVIKEFQYGSWLVANLHLTRRPADSGYPLSWDNIIHDSPSLGYVVATHQHGIDYGPTVLTWFYPFCGDDPKNLRQRLFDMSWEECAEMAMADIETAHPDIRDLATRLDVMRWGHAMVQPRPGFISSKSRQLAAERFGSIHFAGTDLSGMALMEEAFYHGVRAGEEVLAKRGVTSSDSIL